MGFLGVVIAGVATWLLWDNGWQLITVSIIVTAIEFWSWGVMHNYAVDAAKDRPGYSGRFYDFTKREVALVPDWLAVVNLLGFIAAVSLLIAGLVL